jgi:MerR family transcriptional regulator, copper efflux regulator
MNKMPLQELLTIGELSQRTDASVRSIRHYDEHGLLASVRASNGYRMFPEIYVDVETRRAALSVMTRTSHR